MSKKNIKNIRTASRDFELFAGGNCPGPCLDSFSWVYTSLQSKVCFQFCFHIRRPVISPVVSPFKSFYKKSLPKYLIHENSKYQHFDKFFTNFSQIFQFFTFKGRHFSITKLEILIFCGILHLGMDFWNLSWKRIVSS